MVIISAYLLELVLGGGFRSYPFRRHLLAEHIGFYA